MDASFQASVRERAYYLWLEEGRPQGRAEHHWSAAEQDVRGEAGPTRRAAPRKAAASAKAAPSKAAPARKRAKAN